MRESPHAMRMRRSRSGARRRCGARHRRCGVVPGPVARLAAIATALALAAARRLRRLGGGRWGCAGAAGCLRGRLPPPLPLSSALTLALRCPAPAAASPLRLIGWKLVRFLRARDLDLAAVGQPAEPGSDDAFVGLQAGCDHGLAIILLPHRDGAHGCSVVSLTT